MENVLLESARHIVTAGCVRPVKVKGGFFTRCRSRLTSVCPSCAEQHRGDWAAIARSGIFGEDTRPVPGFGYYMLTLTAPSFGSVHRVPRSEHTPSTRCGCGDWHTHHEQHLAGVPLDPDRYDYDGQVRWNRDAPRLWDATRRKLRHHFDDLEYFVVREWQARGVLHLHALLRLPIPTAPVFPSTLLDLAQNVTAVSPVDDFEAVWGEQAHIDSLHGDGDTAKSIWYLMKSISYTLKDITRLHPGSTAYWHQAALDEAARSMPCHRDCLTPFFCPHPKRHQNAGAHGHTVSATRRTSTRAGWSFRALTRRMQRLARQEWMEANRDALPALFTPDLRAFRADALQYLRAHERAEAEAWAPGLPLNCTYVSREGTAMHRPGI